MISLRSDSRFQRYVPAPWYLYEMRWPGTENDMTGSIVYYIGDIRLTLPELQREALSLPAYIKTVLNFAESELTIIFVNSTVPGLGLGTLLLSVAMITAGEESIERIRLDDDSDNYRKPNNIYLKLGMRYEHKDGPEMHGTTKTIARRWRTIRKKYNYVGGDS